MNELNQKFKTLVRLDFLIIIGGLIEVFSYIYLTGNLLLVTVGLITIIPAYMAMKKSNVKWNYFVGIWALVKYNPLGLAIFSFIMGDALMNFGLNTFSTIIMFLTMGLVILAIVGSLVVGIILLVKTSKYIKSQE